MKHFLLEYIIDNRELEKRLEQLAMRYQQINGWGEKDLLQFAVNAMPSTEDYLNFLEQRADEMEKSIIEAGKEPLEECSVYDPAEEW